MDVGTAWVQASTWRDDGMATDLAPPADPATGRRARGVTTPRRRRGMDHTAYTHTEADGYVVPVVDPRLHTDMPDEPGAFAGRPADDRALEIVEGGIGAAAGLAL